MNAAGYRFIPYVKLALGGKRGFGAGRLDRRRGLRDWQETPGGEGSTRGGMEPVRRTGDQESRLRCSEGVTAVRARPQSSPGSGIKAARRGSTMWGVWTRAFAPSAGVAVVW